MSDSKAFWDWSLQRWEDAAFREACLAWQDCGGEVNLLLLAVWQGERGLRWSEDHVVQLLARTQHWRAAVLTPMRQLRACIKQQPGPGPEYEQAKQLELQLERRFQKQLCEHEADLLTHRGSQVRVNLELLYRCSGLMPPAMEAGGLAALWRSR